ncbi:MAG TPA: site-specific integrase [Jatrophihabitans sp.]|nr:site-specific integrase [Jatrophihabitans sp.]
MAATKRRPKRREDGTGSVYPTKDGRFRADVTIGWEPQPDGTKKRIRKVVYGATREQAKTARAELLRKRDSGELPIGPQVTVESWMTYWLTQIAPRRCKVKTLEGYEGMIRHWIIPTIGHLRLLDLQPEHIEQLHDAMFTGKPWTRSNGRVVPAKPLSGSAVRLAHRILSRALRVAEQRGKIPRNPATLVDLPEGKPVAVTKEQYLSLADARKVLNVCDGRWDDARWSVGLALGPRGGERLGLLWDLDVDLAAGTITFQRQLQRRRAAAGRKGALELVPWRKGGKGPKPLHVPPPLLAKLKAHRKRQLERRLALGDEWQQSPLGDLVFTDEYGRAIDPRRDWEDWRDLLAEAGVPYVNPHGSRHTAASILLALKVPLKVVQEILGHSSINVTGTIYAHVAPELAEEAINDVGAALWG